MSAGRRWMRALWIGAMLAMPGRGDDCVEAVPRVEAVASADVLVRARPAGRPDQSAVETTAEGRCELEWSWWVVESVVAGKGPWKKGALLRVYQPGQLEECARARHWRADGRDEGLISRSYESPTRAAEGAPAVLLGFSWGPDRLLLAARDAREAVDEVPRLAREFEAAHRGR